MTTHIAAIGTASDVVTGNVCDLVVATAEATSFRYDDEGAEIAEYTMTCDIVFTADLTVPVSDDDKLAKAIAEADQILYDNDWTRSTDWAITHNAMYADVIEDPAA